MILYTIFHPGVRKTAEQLEEEVVEEVDDLPPPPVPSAPPPASQLVTLHPVRGGPSVTSSRSRPQLVTLHPVRGGPSVTSSGGVDSVSS